MKHKIFLWLPRVLASIYILLLAIFALDVFIPGQTISYYIAAFFIHLIPNFILAAILLIAWKWSKTGGLLFMLLSCVMFYFFKNPLPVNIGLFGPLLLIGVLFFVEGYLIKTKERK